MREKEEVCGTCKWHHKDELGDWICVNYPDLKRSELAKALVD